MAEKIIASEIVNKVSVTISQKEIDRLKYLKKTLDSLPRKINVVADAQIKAAKKVEKATKESNAFIGPTIPVSEIKRRERATQQFYKQQLKDRLHLHKISMQLNAKQAKQAKNQPSSSILDVWSNPTNLKRQQAELRAAIAKLGPPSKHPMFEYYSKLQKESDKQAQLDEKMEARLFRKRAKARLKAWKQRKREANSSVASNIAASIESRRVDFQRVLDSRKLSSASKDINWTAFNAMAEAVKGDKMSLQEFNAELKKMKYNIQSSAPKVKSLTAEFRSMRHAVVAATASWTAFSGAANIVKTGQTFEGIRASMSTWSTDVGDDFQYVTNFAQNLGAELESTAQGFTQLGVTAKGKLSQSDFRNLFEGFTEFSTIATGADRYRMERGMMAINQMLS